MTLNAAGRTLVGTALVDRNHVDFVAGSEPGWHLCHTDIGQSRSRACAKPS